MNKETKTEQYRLAANDIVAEFKANYIDDTEAERQLEALDYAYGESMSHLDDQVGVSA